MKAFQATFGFGSVAGGLSRIAAAYVFTRVQYAEQDEWSLGWRVGILLGLWLLVGFDLKALPRRMRSRAVSQPAATDPRPPDLAFDLRFAMLGLPQGASQKEIRSAYLKLAKLHHPDRPWGDEARFREIQEAYDSLSAGG